MSRTIYTRSNKESKASAFSVTPGDRSQSRPTWGEENQFLEQETKETQSGLKGFLPKEGQPTSSKNQEDFGTAESLNFFNELCNIEDNFLVVFNKLNDVHYINGIVNLSSYTLTKSETSVLSKGLGFALLQGLQTLVILSKIWMFFKEEQDWTCFSQSPIRTQRNITPNQGFHLNTSLLN